MTTKFTPRLDILPPPQRRLWGELAAVPDNGLRVASLLDLAGTKASVVQVRAEAQDYIDIDALLTDGRIDLPAALAAARAMTIRTLHRSMFPPAGITSRMAIFAACLSRLRTGWRALHARSILTICQ